MSKKSSEWIFKAVLAVVGCVAGFYALKVIIWGTSLVVGWIAGIATGAFQGAFKLGLSTLLTVAWLPGLVQGVSAVILALLSVSLTYKFSFATFRSVTIQYHQFKIEHPEAVRKLKRQTPPLVYSAGLVAQMAALFVTELLPDTTTGDKACLIAIGSILIIPGWASNSLLHRTGKVERLVGWLFWVLCVLAVPGVVWVAAKGSLSQAAAVLSSHPQILAMTVLNLLLAVIVPRVIGSGDGEEP